MYPNRHYNKWNMNEINRLYNEYELQELSVDDIAEKHERTVYGIISRLKLEGIIQSWGSVKGWSVDDIVQNDTENIILKASLKVDVEDESYDDECDSRSCSSSSYDTSSINERLNRIEKTLMNICDYIDNQTPFPRNIDNCSRSY
jgi:hypothetical protein